MSEWKECAIESLCKNICSGGTPNRSNGSFYQNGSIPWLNTKEVSFNRIYQTENFITELGLKSSSAKWIPANTVVVAMYGATAGRSAIAKIPLTTNQACCNLTIDEKKADYRFIYYALFNQYSYLASMANGGAQQNLNAGMIREFKINLPDLETQTKIADVLSSLDDKIELNNQINRNLEEQAQALFKNWFIDFAPFGGEMPKDWKNGKLSDIAEYEKEKIDIAKLNTETYYSTENMLSNKAGVSKATSLPTIEQTTRCFPGETIISNIRPYFKKIFYCTEEIAGCSTDVLCFKPKKESFSIYNYSLLYSNDFFDYMVKGSKGTKMPRGDKSQIMNYDVVVPTESVISDFNTVVSNILQQISNNKKENECLAKLRDTLLPNLMSGELCLNT